MPTTENDGARLHYEVSGKPGGALLVLVNGLGSNLHMWDKVLPAFEARHRVLRFDMRGHGESSVSPEPLTIEQLGSDVVHLLDEVQTDRASVCGLSLGGVVTLWLGIHAPERLQRLIFANTAARIGSVEMWEQRIATVRATGMSALAVATLERWFTPTYRAHHPEEMEQIREMIAATDPRGYTGLLCGVARCRSARSNWGGRSGEPGDHRDARSGNTSQRGTGAACSPQKVSLPRARFFAPLGVGACRRVRRRRSATPCRRGESRWMSENGTRRACTCDGACWEMRMWIALRQPRAIWMRSSRI